MTRAKKNPSCRCATKFCRNLRAPNRRVCHKCKQRGFRAARPFASSLATLRDHAKARHIPCLLTYEEWVDFAVREGLFDSEGRRLQTLTVDRVDATKPYQAGNLQVLTHSENVIKGNRERRTKYYQKNRWKFAPVEPIIPQVDPPDEEAF